MTNTEATMTADHYVECSECGHPIERHVGGGCHLEGCACPTWMVEDVVRVRRANGLPGNWKRGDI